MRISSASIAALAGIASSEAAALSPIDLFNKVVEDIHARDAAATDLTSHCAIETTPEHSAAYTFEYVADVDRDEYDVERFDKQSGKSLGMARLRYIRDEDDERVVESYAVRVAVESSKLMNAPIYISPRSETCGRMVVVETPPMSLAELRSGRDTSLASDLAWASKALELVDEFAKLGFYAYYLSDRNLKVPNGGRLMLDSVDVTLIRSQPKILSSWMPTLLWSFLGDYGMYSGPTNAWLPLSQLRVTPVRHVMRILADQQYKDLTQGPSVAGRIIDKARAILSGKAPVDQRSEQASQITSLVKEVAEQGVSVPVGRSITARAHGAEHPLVHRFALLTYLKGTGYVPRPISLSAPSDSTERTLVQAYAGKPLSSLPNTDGEYDFKVGRELIKILAVLRSNGFYFDGPLDWNNVMWSKGRDGELKLVIDSERLVFDVVENNEMSHRNLMDVGTILKQMLARWTKEQYGTSLERDMIPNMSVSVVEPFKELSRRLAEAWSGDRIYYKMPAMALRDADVALTEMLRGKRIEAGKALAARLMAEEGAVAV